MNTDSVSQDITAPAIPDSSPDELSDEELDRRERIALGMIAMLETKTSAHDEFQMKMKRLYLIAGALAILLAGIFFLLNALVPDGKPQVRIEQKP